METSITGEADATRVGMAAGVATTVDTTVIETVTGTVQTRVQLGWTPGSRRRKLILENQKLEELIRLFYQNSTALSSGYTDILWLTTYSIH